MNYKKNNLKPLNLLTIASLLTFFTLLGQEKSTQINDSIKKYLYTNPSKSKKYCYRKLDDTEKNKNYQEKAITYCYLSSISGVLNEKDSVLYFFDKALQIAQDNNDKYLELIVKTNKTKHFFLQFDFETSLTLNNECSQLAKKLNDDHTYNYLLIEKANIYYELERYNEALAIYKTNINNVDFSDTDKLNTRLGLVKTYIKLGKADSANAYISKGITESKRLKLNEHEISFHLQKAHYYIDKNNFDSANESFIVAKTLSKQVKNNTFIIYVKTQLSKFYTIKKEYQKAITTLKSILDENKIETIPTEYLTEIYYLLGENYKSINDTSNAGLYLSLFVENAKKIGQKKIEAIDHLHNIDLEKIKSEENLQKKYRWWMTIIACILVLVLIGFFLLKKKKDKYDRSKFADLMARIEKFEDEKKNSPSPISITEAIKNEAGDRNFTEKPVISINEINNKNETEVNSSAIIENIESDPEEQEEIENEFKEEIENENFVLKSETIEEILDKLIKLEEKKLFLRQDYTLHNVAKRLKTNTAYLSKVINSELDKSFSTYVNELRINYIIIELKNNAKLRSYSIQGIANEIGYKSSESFSKYFRIATGISPTTYIKNINELNKK